MTDVLDPITMEPKDLDVDAIWKDCREWQPKVVDEDGEVNWRAAHYADPGLTSCPACDQYYWNLGNLHKCRKCNFIYPTDAWPMFSWGAQAKRRGDTTLLTQKRMKHAYFRYGYQHGEDGDLSEQFRQIDWRDVLNED